MSLYNALIELVKDDDAFYFKDSVLDGLVYRVFSYRLASYEKFLKPGAMECRGIMFDITDSENPVIKSRPMEKFFNINENPLTTGLDFKRPLKIYEKADGSLISTYIHAGSELRLKSKTSLSSVHCMRAMEWLDKPENKELKDDIYKIALGDYTVNMEWCSPEERIVLPYPVAHLKILNIRKNSDGSYINLDSYINRDS